MRDKHVHLIGVAGTGMGALAGLMRQAGARVTGSDTAFYPPMGDKLREWGVETRQGFAAENLDDGPDLVVIGNVCRANNPEARAAIERGLAYTSMPGALEASFLRHRKNLVVAGTHGKTTTTALLTHLLASTGQAPGFLLGGVPRNFHESFALGRPGGPFVIEGDEYDSAFFEKQPKFFRYLPFGAVLTSVEHDHIDIYPDEASYLAAFEGFLSRLPQDGVVAAYAGCAHVVKLCEKAPCRVVFYGLEGDAVDGVKVDVLGRLGDHEGEQLRLSLVLGGQRQPDLLTPLAGAHNARNALGAIAIAHFAMGTPLPALGEALTSFRGVRRRQEQVAIADGVTVYDDFAHHPTAVRETLRALRGRHREGKLVAIFEPRSATASRALHQAQYPDAFEAADVALIAPVGRPEIDASERLDVDRIAADIEAARGVGSAQAPADHDALLSAALHQLGPGDTLVVMSNGDFKGLLPRLVRALETRERER